jgi:hypothetical protein
VALLALALAVRAGALNAVFGRARSKERARGRSEVRA